MPEKDFRLRLDELTPDPSQPRKTFLQADLNRLAASIVARGILQPIRVRWDKERGYWLILTGESRWRAARIAGLTEVPVMPVDGELSEADLLADRLIENTLRSDLPPMQEARGIATLKALKGCSSKALAEEYGFSGAAITRAEALLSLPPTIQEMVDQRLIAESAGYELSRLPDEAGQLELALALAERRLNRDQVTEAVQSRLGKRKSAPHGSRLSCKLDGYCVTFAAGKEVTLTGLGEVLAQLQKKVRRALDKNLDTKAFLRSLEA
jgi:ParB family transcriptional regulator, chromosome partitioning protein